MEGYSSGHIHNDYSIPSQSRLEINLCFRGSRPGEGNSPGDVHSSDVQLQPIGAGAPLWLQPGPWLNQCSSLTPVSLIDDEDMPEVVQRLLRTHQQNLICGGMESEEPMQDTLEHQPTFSFDPPGTTPTNQPSRHDSVASVDIKTEPDLEQLMPSQPLRIPRARRSPKTEYDEATMKDFQQHLGVIDLRHGLDGWPYQAGTGNMAVYGANLADIDYRRQLMLLEQQKIARLEMAKKGQ
jgi:hypothetical protein